MSTRRQGKRECSGYGIPSAKRVKARGIDDPNEGRSTSGNENQAITAGQLPVADFFYFGLSFYYIKATVKQTLPEQILFSELHNAADMKRVIERDSSMLAKSGLGKLDAENGEFGSFWRVLELDKLVYVYEHTVQVNCSSTLYSQLKWCFDCIPTHKKRALPCTKSNHHLCLEPFYSNNEEVLQIYQEAQCEAIKDDVELLKDIVDGNKLDSLTKFECPSSDSNNWNENDWTRRLAPGIQTLIPNSVVHYTAEFGMSWTTKYLKVCLGVHPSNSRFFLFSGVPDVMIKMKTNGIVVSGNGPPKEPDSSDNEMVENTHQRPSMKGRRSIGPPEKLGEVYAGLHIVLVSKILRRLYKGKLTCDIEHSVQGILIDKVCGAYQCSISVQMKENNLSSLKLELIDYSGSLLTSNKLCMLLQKLATHAQ